MTFVANRVTKQRIVSKIPNQSNERSKLPLKWEETIHAMKGPKTKTHTTGVYFGDGEQQVKKIILDSFASKAVLKSSTEVQDGY